MKTKVDIWNVGHGEAMRLVFGRECSVVRDFGSATSTGRTGALAEIPLVAAKLLASPGRREAVLSHAHEDHFNGFRFLCNQGVREFFEAAYVPWLDFSTRESLGALMTLHTAYLFSYLLPDDPARYDLRNWLGAAPVMAALSKSLYGVASGYAFNWPLAARVLWPPPPAHPFVNHERLVARHSVKQIENAFRGSKQGRVVSQVRRHSGTLTRLLSRYYPRQENERAAGEVTRLIRTSQEYNPTHDDLNTLNDVLLSLESIEITRTRATDAAIRVGLERSQASINNHSIVFDLGDRALFLSDLDGGSMNRMAQEYMSGRQSYDFLKSAHHGTQLGVDSFLDRVPQCDLVLHCCGSAHPQYNPPTDAYCLLDPRKIVCTDRHPRLTQLRSGYRYEFFDSRKKVFRL